MTAPLIVGIISDTHGLLRPEALDVLAGASLILHAGDIGSPDVLERLRACAPVHAVRGNNDTDAWASAVPERQTVDVDGWRFYVLHNLRELDIDPVAANIRVVVAGHSHKPLIEHKDGVLFLNPGSAGPRRFSLPITVARVTVESAALTPEIITLA